VTPFYDPMIAKVIVHDRDRTSALRRMAALMGATEVVGVTTNAALLKALCAHPAFVGGEVDTGFIERHRATLFTKPAPAGDRAFAVATLARLLEWQDAATPAAGDPWSPWNQQSGFRLLEEGHEEVRWKDGEREVFVIARRLRGGGVRLELPEGAREARVERRDDGTLAIGFGQDSFVATVVRRTALDGGIDYTLFMDGGSSRLRLVDPLDVTQYEATASADAVVRAPLPGKIIDLKVKAGDAAPDFKLKDTDGKEVSLDSLKGKVVLLDFWATWCGPCKAAMPLIQKIHEDYKSKGVAVYGVNTWEKKEGAGKKYMDDKKYTYGCLLAGDDLASKGYGTSGIPTLVIIDKGGKIAMIEVGLGPDGDKKLRAAIDASLAK
jgi:thiol-disulfide isomerase/thioredoxin